MFFELNWNILLFGPLIGFSVGILTGFFGAGGGFIVTPALNIFLGLEMNYAVGTSACQVLGASSFALCHRLDKRLMGIKVAVFTGLGIPPGSFFGCHAVRILKGMEKWAVNGRTIEPVNLILLLIFTVFLFLLALWLFYDNFYLRRRHHSESEKEHRGLFASVRIPPVMNFRTIPSGRFSVPVLVALGICMGFLSGLLGIGGGVIMMPMLFYLVGQETKHATQTDMMLIFVSGLFSTIFHAMDKNINYPLAAALMAGSFFGARLGADLQKNVTGKTIRKYFAFVVFGAGCLTLIKIFGMLL